MQDTTSNNKRIAKNTIMLYIRMFISMLVGLYTSRVVLATLGVEDYGIYGVVGGVVAMMGFLNASMSGATSRFLTFELGRGDKDRLAKTFSSALIVHIAIAIIVFILAETVGLWFLCNKLNIPEGRMEAAHWVYQFSILATMLSITQVPYNATIIAHEKMDVYAYMEILNVTLKLLIVYLLTIGDFDKLKLYASLLLAVSILIMMVYRIYAIRQFPEAHFHWIWDKTYLRPLLSFSGWDLYGNMSVLFFTQGIAMLLNIFFGPVLNAANNITTVVQVTIKGFAYNVIQAFRPYIIKQYAQNRIDEVNAYMVRATQFTLVFYSLVAVPFYLEVEYILRLWLGVAPELTAFFLRIILVATIFNLANNIINIPIHAKGEMKLFSIITGSCFFVSIPLMYVGLKLGATPEISYCVVIVAYFSCLIASLFTLKHNIPATNIKSLLYNGYFKSSVTIFLGFLISYVLKETIINDLVRLLLIVLCNAIFVVVISLFLFLNSKERSKCYNILISKFIH